jgi:hypothetical protein
MSGARGGAGRPAPALAALPGFASVFEVIDGVVVVNAPDLLDPIQSSVHHQGRPCVHLDTPKPPVLLLLGWDAVAAARRSSAARLSSSIMTGCGVPISPR